MISLKRLAVWGLGFILFIGLVDDIKAQSQLGLKIHHQPLLEATQNNGFGSEIVLSHQGNITHLKNDLYLLGRIGVIYQPTSWYNEQKGFHGASRSDLYDGTRFGVTVLSGFYLKRKPVSPELAVGPTWHRVFHESLYDAITIDMDFGLNLHVSSMLILRTGLVLQQPVKSSQIKGFLLRPSTGLKFKFN